MTEPHPTPGTVEHRPDCPGAEMVRRQSGHRDLIICRGCGALTGTRRRRDWTGT